MRPNCPLCGKHLSLEEARDRENTAIAANGTEIVICSSCGKIKNELKEKLRRASAISPSQINLFKTKDNAQFIELIKRESKWREQAPAEESTGPKKDAHGCIVGVETWNTDLHQCVKIEKHPPTPIKEQIPAQPVVPVGPITIEQKVAALNDKVAEMEKKIHYIFGLLNVMEGK